MLLRRLEYDRVNARADRLLYVPPSVIPVAKSIRASRRIGETLKISFSKYSAFLQNPERFRLYYMLGLSPEGADTPSNFNYGRRRGSCFHAIQEARAKGVRDSVITEHKFDQALYERCVKLVEAVPGFGNVLVSEKEFELPIGDGKHSITGRIDHIVDDAGVIRVGDFKTTKKRTKFEMQQYFGDLVTSSQSHFYVFAAAALGYETDQFLYHVCIDEKDKPKHIPLDVRVTKLEVTRTMRHVYAACEAIEGLIERVGIDNPWPHSNHFPCAGDRFFCGYSAICGRTLPKGAAPQGFITKYPEENK